MKIKPQRNKKSINSIFRFPQIGGKKDYWIAELSLNTESIVEYTISDAKGKHRGFIFGKTLEAGALWLWKDKQGHGGIYNANRPVNMKSRKEMLQAVRFAYLKTQDW